MSDTKTKELDKLEIAKAVEQIELSQTNAWSDLDALASSVVVESIEVDPESIVVDETGTSFKGALNVYLTLHYGGNDPDGFSSGASFWGLFDGHLENQTPKVDNVSIDTQSFYG